ncbi:glycosyltransferase family 1 protein [Brasilonema octagenarum UFV-E1]|uniref:Glycosyltransferase family 1 protein n=1 Tax=Brasilonema sennae CENA114 TaxID=415709 RepID=A0A856MGS1_9CYAN|nr:glycosyltransferase [Brasilonema sennae]QDL08871.1 glycosyltransferase family 1 protein [Brasilonema sennae CENA114]QDL15228.1 glycosyltransferase family 1 protein [Brasilonema octagenarum UFV-E1]
MLTKNPQKIFTKPLSFYSNKKPRILVVSMRGFHSEVYRSVDFEFEDLLCTFDYADILTPTLASGKVNSFKKKLSNNTARAFVKGKLLNSGCMSSILDREYDLLFFLCQHFWDITSINSIKGWREKCRKTVLWIDEIWVKEMEEQKTKLCFELAKDFDYIFTTLSSSVDAIANLVQRPCISLPFAVDAIKFCPYPERPQRHIDVYSIGRRSPIVHKTLLEVAERKNFLYLFDSLKGLQMGDYKEHRTLYSHLIKRSRYFIANKAKFDAIDQTGAQDELCSRFFEGAAGGTVMIGTPPVCEAYTTYFNWSDAVIQIPYDPANVADMITELDARPDYVNRIRKENVMNSLLRHDWVYRWEQVLKQVGLESTPEMLSRKTDLANLADKVKTEC